MTDHIDNLALGAAIAIVGGLAIICLHAVMMATIQNPARVARVAVSIGVFISVSYICGYILNEVDITVEDITTRIVESVRRLF